MSRFSQTFLGVARIRSVLHSLTRQTFALNLITSAVVLLLCAGYIVQVNATAAKGYAIRELETTLHELSLANEQLELETQQAQSMANVMRSVKMIGMVEGKTPVYVQAGSPTYVLAR